ncbi:CAF17-like 4Fe-4S cluster assembly/insertion protein YgfZ [Prochlorothrix hollandica]|uniref:Glycine cleavage system protein T n=1 Tax=Prochlorothrix hollandica PCC 9006 = CALU 1027 TaxID=317619 RepID=A0A0M2PUP7_PROHO|nr:folate-binding protein YgfZ [Prochlorothrix hollandica]KKI98812.1 glycine cleavage system protein T [Prochlorothrix hollandica PCC 9006 = CALU 1027]
MTLLTLRELQARQGAVIDAAEAGAVPQTFGREAEAIAAVHQDQGVVLCDRSHWGCLDVLDRDRLRFLHNQSTNNFQTLQPGQGCETVFVTATARTLDLATAYVLADRVRLLLSPNRRQQIHDWLDRYIFPFDKVKLVDCSGEVGIFSLLGSHCGAWLQQLGIPDLPSAPHSHLTTEFQGSTVHLAQGSGLATEGYTLLVPGEQAAAAWHSLTETPGTPALPLGRQGWEQLRIQQGRPQPDRELTEDYNPLEAGLWQTVSFDKGCYIGQETIARLNTYKGVKQRLWGLRFQGQPEPGTLLTVADQRVGKVTSVVPTAEGSLGLGYIRTKAGGLGLQVQAGEVMGEVVPLAYVSHPALDPDSAVEST